MVFHVRFHRQKLLTIALEGLGMKIDYAINVDVPDENIVNRMGGRRACVGCGATYHIAYAPTSKEGICEKCGGGLILRGTISRRQS